MSVGARLEESVDGGDGCLVVTGRGARVGRGDGCNDVGATGPAAVGIGSGARDGSVEL
jgi:hypothetical protein